MKETITDELSLMLLRKGFVVKNLSRGCFDIFARKEDIVLLLKVLEDANSVSEEYASEISKIASYINAVPLVIARKAGLLLEDNIIYSRFGIYTLNASTFRNSLNNQMPFVKKSNAGVTATVFGEKIKQKREELGLSLNSLSRKMGVSGRMASKYEEGVKEVTISRAFRIYDLLGGSVFKRIDVLHPRELSVSTGDSDYSRKYNELGFNATDTKNAPFDVIARKGNDVILTELGDKMKPGFESISKLMDAGRLVIFRKKKPKNIPSMKKEEFLEIQKAKELIKIIREHNG
ncbi:helix-turn-helix domain-containing protein [Candidatus Woesearchaeota archaeon]|nr:helix-turn-helix domain-containing protein [Candidatus Woesearchaeota archaeon]